MEVVDLKAHEIAKSLSSGDRIQSHISVELYIRVSSKLCSLVSHAMEYSSHIPYMEWYELNLVSEIG